MPNIDIVNVQLNELMHRNNPGDENNTSSSNIFQSREDRNRRLTSKLRSQES